MALTLQCDDKFDPDKLIKMPSIPFFRRMMVRLMAPIYLPRLIFDSITT